MKHCWAEELLTRGLIRFWSLAFYREWENEVLGDPKDGEGMFRMDGRPYGTDSVNPVYAWCASLPTITAGRTLQLAEQGKYDCVVRVHEPLLLIQRIRVALTKINQLLLLHCAKISYNKGTDVDERTLNSQKFHFNVFQKSSKFAPDREYRLSLTDTCLRPEPKCYVDITFGECSDILSIEELPDKTMQADARTLRR